MTAAGSRISEIEGDFLQCEVGVRPKGYGRRSKILWPSQGAAAETKSSNTGRVGGTQDCRVAG